MRSTTLKVHNSWSLKRGLHHDADVKEKERILFKRFVAASAAEQISGTAVLPPPSFVRGSSERTDKIEGEATCQFASKTFENSLCKSRVPKRRQDGKLSLTYGAKLRTLTVESLNVGHHLSRKIPLENRGTNL